MNRSDLVDLELTIARTRMLLPILAAVSVWVDPTVPDLTPWFALTGGPFAIDRSALAILGAHLVYSLVFYALALGGRRPRAADATNVLDVLFAVAIAVFTEGRTSPAYVFFSFAILAVGCREGFRTTLVVTAACVTCYFGLIAISSAGESWSYEMRPAYLAITGYLIAVLGQERVAIETRAHEAEATAKRHEIARSLHDGYVQALAGVNLRLETCRERIRRGETERALAEVTELQRSVAREYDEVRRYVRALAGAPPPSPPAVPSGEARFTVDARFSASSAVVEQVLHILLEGARNVARHAGARSASLAAHEEDGAIHLTIDDDGAGLAAETSPPWSIASRVAELGGEVRLLRGSSRGAHLAIDLPERAGS
jgi:signal transduction histidine kinase